MKKVLLAFDGEHFSKGVFEFAKQINKLEPILATGFFLPSIDYLELLYSYGGIPAGPLYVNEVVQPDEKIIKRNIDTFKELCKQHGIECNVHTDFEKHVLDYVKSETRYADLMVMNGKSYYQNLGKETQQDYIENTLHKAECPVLLLPEEYSAPSNIIMAYDGSESSVFAIKQFSYLFPQFHDRQVLLAYINKHTDKVPDRSLVEELLSCHFSRFSILKLKINSHNDLLQWIASNDNAILVSGAYGRSMLSELFKKSFITSVVQEHKTPIFVAHK